jgi:signal transduction histidine kinase
VGHFEAGSSLLVILVSAYSVGAHNQNLRVSLAAGLIFAAASGFGPGQPAAQMWPDFAFSAVLVLLPLSVGVSMRRQVRRAVLAERRTVTLEFTQQQRAHEAVQQERRRIARELHDIVSHGLGLVVLHAGVADRVLDTDPARARESLQLIRETGQEAIREMGTLVNLAREDTAASRDPQPNLTDVERLVATTRAAGLNVRLVRLGEQRPLTAAVELNAYRVIQEGLTNALKHAGAATVTVALRYQPDGIDVEVTDDGASGTAGGGGRHGLLGLRERVAVFGGTFDAGGAPEGGWTLRATFPTTR